MDVPITPRDRTLKIRRDAKIGRAEPRRRGRRGQQAEDPRRNEHRAGWKIVSSGSWGLLLPVSHNPGGCSHSSHQHGKEKAF